MLDKIDHSQNDIFEALGWDEKEREFVKSKTQEVVLKTFLLNSISKAAEIYQEFIETNHPRLVAFYMAQQDVKILKMFAWLTENHPDEVEKMVKDICK